MSKKKRSDFSNTKIILMSHIFPREALYTGLSITCLGTGIHVLSNHRAQPSCKKRMY